MGNRRRMMDTIKVVYSNGVYIESIDGMLFSASEWTGNLTANSIVVIADDVSFRMALHDRGTTMRISESSLDPLENFMKAIRDPDQAKLDMKSSDNTDNILKLQGSESYAAGYCKQFTFPNGKMTGLLPALGWWKLVYDNLSAVNACLSSCGGSELESQYWSSTFCCVSIVNKARGCWTIRTLDGSALIEGIGDYFKVRPFAEYR